MFQPHPTPYPPFPSYGVVGSAPGVAADSIYQHNPDSSVVDNSGPIVFRDPVLRSSGQPTTFHALSQPPQLKMEGAHAADDLERQEAMAREYKPDLEVCGAA